MGFLGVFESIGFLLKTSRDLGLRVEGVKASGSGCVGF